MSTTDSKQETFNPFDPEEFSTGGGAWGDQDVQITYSRYAIHRFIDAQGVDKTAGEPETYHIVKGRIVGEDKERQELYRVGRGRKASADGETLVWAEGDSAGQPATINANSEHGRFLTGLNEAKYDFSTFTKGGVPKVSTLEGVVLRFKGEVKKKRDGAEVRDKKGFLKYLFIPTTVVATGNGKDTSIPQSDIDLKAKEALYATLIKSGNGGLTRPLLVRGLMSLLSGKPNAMAIVNRATDETWLRAQTELVKYDGTTVNLL